MKAQKRDSFKPPRDQLHGSPPPNAPNLSSMPTRADLSNGSSTATPLTVKHKARKLVKEPDVPATAREQEPEAPSPELVAQLSDEYTMESNLFDYDELRVHEQFGIKVYIDAVFKGLLAENKREGYGVMIYKNGRVYEGMWAWDKRNGKGYERYANGNKYEGMFTDGKANGKGVYTWNNGEVYDGEWIRGVKNGYGVWKGLHGDSYIGEWKNSKADGYGVHSWKNGDRYEGEW